MYMKQVAFITGASSGIGKATAKLLAQKGYTVYGAARRIAKMNDLQEAGIHLIELDLANEASMVAAIDNLLQNEGRIDILINNAGYGSYGAMEDVPLSEAKYQFEVNIFGLARITQLALPAMRKQQSGKIINISSIGGSFGEPHGAWYHASKYAVEGLSDSLRMELKQFGIDVIIIKPGAILTDWSHIARENLLKTSADTAYSTLAQKHAQMLANADKNGSTPAVVANTILKAIESKRPKTRYLTGSGANMVMFLKSVLSDRLFDKVMLSMINR